MPPLRGFPRGHWLRLNDFSRVIDLAKTMTSLKPFERAHWPRRNHFDGVIYPQWNGFSWDIDPAETISAGSSTPLKRFSRGQWAPWLPEFFFNIFSYKITKLWKNSTISCKISAGSFQRGHKNFSRVNNPAEIILVGSITPLKLFGRGQWPH
jgi:hypothetical protein